MSSLAFLIMHEILTLLIYWHKDRTGLAFNLPLVYFLYPLISAIFIIILYFILNRFYHPKNNHYLLYIVTFALLLVPQLMPQFFYGLDIIYFTWTFVISTTATGVVIFRSLVLKDIDKKSRDNYEFIYEELKFYLDKLQIAWLTLGSILAVCMTILWTSSDSIIIMSSDDRVFWSVYMVICFICVSLLVACFVVFPLFKKINEAKNFILSSYKKTTDT